MKALNLLACLLVTLEPALAQAPSPETQPATNAAPAAPPPPAVAPPIQQALPAVPAGPSQPAEPASESTPAQPSEEPRPDAMPVESGAIRLNFRGVPLEMVLDHLSEAAGFIIVLDAQPRGRVDVWSNHPVTKDEAVNLLNSVLQKNGLAAIRKGRTLTIINRDEAKIKAIPVKSGSDPDSIPDNDEMVTQIIPVRFVEVTQLLKDLQPLVSVQTAMTANESGNSIVITDTQANVRRVAEIIQAIDAGAEDVTEVRVFRLNNADPVEMSELLTSLFPDDSRSGSSQSPFRFGGFRDFFRGGGSSTPSSGSQNTRIRKRTRVVVVPDQRTSSIAVTATKDLMEQIEEVVTVLDEDPARRQSVKVFQLQNADPQEALDVLENIFQKSGTQTSRNANQGSVLQNRSEQQQNQFNSARTGNTRNSSRQSSTMRR